MKREKKIGKWIMSGLSILAIWEAQKTKRHTSILLFFLMKCAKDISSLGATN